MKKIFTLLIALCMSVGAWAQRFHVDGIYYNVTDATELTVGVTQDYSNGYSGDITIPENVEYDSKNYTVTSIGYYAFGNYNDKIVSITLPNTLINIGERAFVGCNKLISITIPSSVKEIGSEAFYNSNTSAIIVNSTTPPTLGYGVFYHNAIITVPVGSKTDYEATNWSEYTLKEVGEIVVGEKFSAENKGSEIYYRVTSVSPFEVEMIESPNAYSGEITIPATVNWSNEDFSITSIGENTFYSCDGLTSINIDNENQSYSSADGVLYNKEETTLIIYPEGKKNSEFTIPNSVNTIKDYAFYGCINLTSVTIPSSVANMSNYAFNNCSNLTLINVDAANQNYSSEDGVLYNKEETTLIKYPEGKGNNEFTVPNSVNKIEAGAFINCRHIAVVNISSSVTSIEGSTFANCTSLTSVTIPEGVTSIKTEAFRNCSSLTSITIPSTVTSISSSDNSYHSFAAFYDCSNLAEIILKGSTPPTVDMRGVGGNSNTLITVPVGSRNDYANTEEWNNYTIREEGETVYIGLKFNSLNAEDVDILYRVTSVSPIEVEVLPNNYSDYKGSISIPATVDAVGETFNVTSIGNGAFEWCYDLSSITMPNVTAIGNSAFKYCESITSITMPNVATIGDNAFDGCSRLSGIVIDANNPNYSFDSGVLYNKDKSSLIMYLPGNTNTEFTIPSTVNRIEDNAFNTYSLGTLTIPASVQYIGSNALNYIKYIISLSDVPAQLGDNAFGYYYDGVRINTVPNEAAKSTYSTTSQWSEFTTRTPDELVDDMIFTKDNITYRVSLEQMEVGVVGNTFSGGILTIPATVEYLDEQFTVAAIVYDAFEYNASITEINIPASVYHIAEGVFQIYPEEIGDLYDEELYLALNYTQNLRAINVDADNKHYKSIDGILYNHIGDSLLAYPVGKQGIVTVANGVTTIVEEAFAYCFHITEVKLPNSVITLDDDALYAAVRLETINIPASLINIDGFGGAIALNAINVDANHPVLSSIDGIIYDKTQTTLAFCPQGRSESVNIPNTVYKINAFAFDECSKLENINIPSSVVSIGFRAFDDTKWYEDLYNNHSDGEVYVGNVLYDYKGTPPANYHLIIKEGTIAIADDFMGGNNGYEIPQVTEVTAPNSLVYIGSEALTSTQWYSNLPEGMHYLGNVAYKYKGNIAANETFTIKEGIVGIADDCFSYQRNLSSLVIPSSVSYLGGAFYGCTNLTSITCSASTPPVIMDYNAFTVDEEWNSETDNYIYTSLTTQATLYVPQGSKALYLAAEQWKDFDRIEEFEPTSIQKPQATQPFTQQGNTLVFAQETNIAVYSLSGACVYKGNTQSYTLTQKGMFVVVSNGNAFKVISR